MANKSLIPDSLSLKDELKEKEKKYHGSYALFGMTLLTNPGYVSGNRSTMFTNHLKQFVNLLKPDYPRVSMGFENMVGDNSTGYYRVDNDTTIYRRIPKFDEDRLKDHIYYDFVYDEKTEEYDVIEKKIVEDLTEKFGFPYDTSTQDSFAEDDTIPAGTVIYKTTSYDEEMNYCYGKNGLAMFALDPFIIEDAIEIRTGFTEDMKSIESEWTSQPINDNDVLRNLFGDSKNYKGFPDIGEHTKHKMVSCTTRIKNDQIMFSLKNENQNKVNFLTDVPCYCDGVVVDIEIYANKPIEEIKDNDFNAQILKYLRMQRRFNERINATCEELLNSGKKCSKRIKSLYSRSTSILDPMTKYRNDTSSSAFSNIIIEFHVVREVGVYKGQKLTGRMGNKGVVSRIVPDEDMPILENGKRIDVIWSTLGMPNRLISLPLFEQSITFICNRVIELKIVKTDDFKEKEDLWFDIITRFNSDEGKKLKKYYKGLKMKEKEEFWSQIEAGIYTVVTPPLWEEEVVMFDKIKGIYEAYPWIEPYDVFMNKWGRTIKIMHPLIIGNMYIMKLKQTSKKGFSARSTGGLNQRGLPTKTTKAKYHEELYSDTPVSHSDQEIGNMSISLDPTITARAHMYTRSSKTGRRKVGEWLATNKDGIESFPPSTHHKNANVAILQALFKSMGNRLEFEDEKMIIRTPIENCSTYYDNGSMIIGSESDYREHVRLTMAEEHYTEDCVFVGEKGDYQKVLQEYADGIDLDIEE